MKYSKYQKKQGFFAGKGFYIVLAACVAAVGIAAWSAMSTISSVEDNFSSSLLQYSSQQPTESEADVGQTVSDVTDSRVESAEETSSEPPAPSSELSIDAPAFAIPLKGNIGKIHSDSELQYSATYGDMRLHLGVDIQADKGTEVRSAAPGTVKQVSDDALWGRMVVIDHGDGIICYYCGLENTTVNNGEEISAGTKIGVVGTVPSECADISHIHIAVTRDGKYISPLDLLK